MRYLGGAVGHQQVLHPVTPTAQLRSGPEGPEEVDSAVSSGSQAVSADIQPDSDEEEPHADIPSGDESDLEGNGLGAGIDHGGAGSREGESDTDSDPDLGPEDGEDEETGAHMYLGYDTAL